LDLYTLSSSLTYQSIVLSLGSGLLPRDPATVPLNVAAGAPPPPDAQHASDATFPAQSEAAQAAADPRARGGGASQNAREHGGAPTADAAATAGATPQTSADSLQREWETARAAVERVEKPRGTAGQACRHAALLVAQTARVRYVVWEKARGIVETLGQMRASGDEATLHACCAAVAAKLITQGAILVEKSPGMAYALADLALAVGVEAPEIWEHLLTHFRAGCCYTVPCYVRRPTGGSVEQWKLALGYAQLGNGGFESKEQYYNRMAGFVTLYAAVLQAEQVTHVSNDRIEIRPATNALGAAAAWGWLARLLNQKPQRITATILLSFLKPTAHVLAATYRRQFRKLLSFLRETYLPMLKAVVDQASSAGVSGGQGAEERAALAVLDAWLGEALTELERKGRLRPPEEKQMPEYREPDDTSCAQDDSW